MTWKGRYRKGYRMDLSQAPRAGFWEQIASSGPDECWPWTGLVSSQGYGKHANKYYAHRLAWYFTNGEIPGAMFVCHKCDNPPCCNPSHLFLGTHQENITDMRQKRRHAYGITSGMSKLSPSKAESAIFLMTLGLSQRQAGEVFGTTQSLMSLLWLGRTGWTQELLPSEYCEGECCSFEGERALRQQRIREARAKYRREAQELVSK